MMGIKGLRGQGPRVQGPYYYGFNITIWTILNKAFHLKVNTASLTNSLHNPSRRLLHPSIL